jgi:hypothetical protein
MLAADTGSTGNVVLVRVPNGGQAVAANITEGGTIHLLYNSGDIPYYVKSSDGGESFSSPIVVVDRASRKPALVFSSRKPEKPGDRLSPGFRVEVRLPTALR